MNKLYLNFRRQFVFIVLLLPFLGLSQTAIPAGDYVISSSNNGVFPNFKTITSAINYLNNNGIKGNIRFLLKDTIYDISKGEEFPITITQFSGSKDFTVTIKPNISSNVSINASTLYYNNPLAVFKLEGADNIIFDGSNTDNETSRNLTLYNTNPYGNNSIPRAVLWIASKNKNDGANNIRIKNIVLKQHNKGTISASIGIFAGGTSSVTSAAEAANSNTTITNVEFNTVGQAIYVNGNEKLLSSNWTISGNLIGNTSDNNELKPYLGINLLNVKEYEISGNIIDGLIRDYNHPVSSSVSGIWVDGKSSGKIFNNKIANVRNNQGDSYLDSRGIYINSSNNFIYNNFISNVSSAVSYGSTVSTGIYIASGSENRIHYNTIAQLISNNNAQTSSCLYLSEGKKLDIRNNIFYNTGSGKARYAVYSEVDKSKFSDINFNDYYAPIIGFLNGDKITLDAWKTATGKDKNSINFSPFFVSPSDLHLKDDKRNIDALRAGTPITEILTDIDGEIRNATKPYMGADELLCLLSTPVAQITQPTCDLPTGSIALSQLPPGKWTINFGASIISGTGTTTVLSNLPSGIYNIKVSTEEGCTSAPLTVELDPVTNTWEGNWSAKKPPTINQHIIFKDDFVSQTDIEGCSCTVERGDVVFKSLGAQRGFNLTVAKEVKVMTGGSLTFESNTNLLQLDKNAVNSGKITVEREIKDMDNVLTGPGAQMDYVYWSSPVAGQKTKGLDGFSPGTPPNRFYSYRESNDYFYETTDLTFVPGRGYAVRAEVSPTIPANPKGYDKIYKFYGTPHNGEYAVVVKRSPNTGAGGGVIHGYNLIGNPYPSNIDFKQLYTQNLRVIYNTAWFWTNNSFEYSQQAQVYPQNNYAVYNGTGGAAASGPVGTSAGGTGNTAKPDGIISVGQGFIVQVREFDSVAGEQTLKFQHDNRGEKLRVSTPGAFFNRQSEQTNRFWLNLISPSLTVNNQLVGYIDGATDDFEQDYDAELLSFGSDVFYSVLGDRNLQIQGKAAFTQEDKVILGANFFSTGTYTIILEEAEGLFKSSQPIYLKDKETGRLTNLSQESYTFEAIKGVSTGRFEIVYKPKTVLGTGDESVQEIQVYRDAGNFVVRSRTKKITDVELYDTSGRLIYKDQPNAATAIISAEKLTAGMYILKIDQNGTITGKKILK